MSNPAPFPNVDVASPTHDTQQEEKELKQPLLTGEEAAIARSAGEASSTAPAVVVAQGVPVEASMNPTLIPSTVSASTVAVLPPPAQGRPVNPYAAVDIPNSLQLWSRQKLLFRCWLPASLASLLLFLMLDMGTGIFVMAQLAAVMGVIASGLYLFPACGAGIDLGTQVKATYVMAMVAVLLDVFTCAMVDSVLLMVALDCSDGEIPLEDQDVCGIHPLTTALVFSVLLASHAWLSLNAAKAARHMMLLLNPVSSGAVRLA